MPKKIENLREKIVHSAGELFSCQGYRQTDMKAIAQKAGTGVGNLYNYFPSKKILLMEVMLIWMDYIYEESVKIDEEEPDLRQFLIRLLTFFIESGSKQTTNMEAVMMEIPEMFKTSGKPSRYSKEFFLYIGKLTELLSKRLEEARDEGRYEISLALKYPRRFIYSLLSVHGYLLKSFPNEEEKNIDFIEGLIPILIKEVDQGEL